MKTINSRLVMPVLLLVAGASFAFAAPRRAAPDAQTMNEVRKQLVTLPYYGVFDNLAYQLDGDTVTLSGQVVRPMTRKDAERRVARVEGVRTVVNNIEVLPVSQFDDSIRVRTYRAVFRSGSLYRYARGANPSIHIIVNRGRVTLEGVVSARMDAQLAYMAARGVPGVFSVTNNLRIEGRS
ncbi:MAG TPA: BON domain-containing protein [Blastocatellia bacterium]|nr:BON domain-containing protein [Blastocatellia bacterium]